MSATFAVGISDELRYKHEHPDDHARWLEWVSDTIGEHVYTCRVVLIELGEGTLRTIRLFDDNRLTPDGQSIDRYEATYYPKVAPPCWPTNAQGC